MNAKAVPPIQSSLKRCIIDPKAAACACTAPSTITASPAAPVRTSCIRSSRPTRRIRTTSSTFRPSSRRRARTRCACARATS
ncbi:hypothetical protein CA830_24860, partial [Burkholderia multivorans]